MNRIAKFEKISFKRFKTDYIELFGTGEKADAESEAMDIYDKIKLPVRATAGSAGYDFMSPLVFTLDPGESIRIPTGIRVKMDEGWVLMVFPRSSLGFKYSLRLNNTVGIIDRDYYDADNEGHIHIKITNETHEDKTLAIKSGESFAQGIFLPFGITSDDSVSAVRTGGFGSTNK